MVLMARARAWVAGGLVLGGLLLGAMVRQEHALLAIQPAVIDPGTELAEVELILVTGERFKGLLRDRTPQTLTLVIEGIATEFRASTVQRVVELGTITDQYRKAREAISDRDTEQLMLLCNWLIARKRFDAALAELDHILSIEPGKPEAVDARRLVLAHRALQERRAGPNEPSPPPDDEAPVPGLPLLTPEQINLIKVYEIDLGSPPKMVVTRETIDRLVDRYAGHDQIPASREQREALYRKRPEQVLELMFRLRARDLYGEVKVLGHPRSVEAFRDDVHRMWLVNSCATTRCHGGEEAGRLRLHVRRMNSDATVYTNLLILDRFRLADGRPLINYDKPAESPLLHLGLPRGESAFPHPKPAVGGDAWRAVFRSTEDRNYLRAVEWISKMYRPRPEYPVVYPPGKEAAAPPPEEGDGGGEGGGGG